MKAILFVCLGNICRSPAAEGVFLDLLHKKHLKNTPIVDSAGTSAFHRGEKADKRMREHALKRGIRLESLSRGFVNPSDFQKFDLILAMDKSNQRNLLELAGENSEYQQKIKLFCDYCKNFELQEVPDPYYGGAQGFELVLDLVEDGCQGILDEHFS